jgi:hypothetical protein
MSPTPILNIHLFEGPIVVHTIQSDQKENTSEHALQIIGHVVAEFYTNKRSIYFIINYTS